MRISAEALQICAGIRDCELKGIKPFEMNEEKIKANAESIGKELMDAGMFELKPDKDEYIFSALGDLIINLLAHPDVWISFDTNEASKKIYIRGEIYAYVKLIDEYYDILLLPSLPLVFGACAESIEDSINGIVNVEGESNNTKLKLTLENKKIIDLEDGSGKIDEQEEPLANAFFQWIIFGLKVNDWEGDMKI